MFVLAILFAAGVTGLMVVRGRAIRAPAVESIRSQADYRIKDVRLSEETPQGVRWQLDADQAETFGDSGTTALKKVTVRIEDRNGRWTLTGDEADYTQATKDVELRGNVVLVSEDGLRLETGRLSWDARRQRAWTRAPVTLYRDRLVVRGQGLDVFVGEDRATMQGRVHAVIGSRPPGEPAPPDRAAGRGRR